MNAYMPRFCFRKPIPEIHEAAGHLNMAVSAHMRGERGLADEMIRRADMPIISEWTESLWGSSQYLEKRDVPDTPPVVPISERPKPRMPSPIVERSLLDRDGHHCRFCGIPVVTKKVRDFIRRSYPEALRWAPGNANQHFGFQAMWVILDHIKPWARGGESILENLVVACAPCNFARSNLTLEQVGLINPMSRGPVRPSWDGLERFVTFEKGRRP